MKKILTALLTLSLLSSYTSPAFSANKVVAGATCAKAGQVSASNKPLLICTKNGKKLIWKEAGKASFTPPAEPTSFENLYANRAGVSYAAWRKISESIKGNTSKLGTLDIHTGPNSSPIFDKPADVLALVSRAFPNSEESKKIVVIRYQYKDLKWAETEIRKVITTEEYNQLNGNEGGRLLTSNCEDSQKTCMGSKQLTTQSGLNLIFQGIPEPQMARDTRFSTGMLEAHEYFHSLQRIPMLGKPLGREDFPRSWIGEGSAEWVQNVVVNYTDYASYKNYIRSDCSNSAGNLSESEIAEFLGAKTNEEANKYDQWLNYCLGAYAIESLVAVKDQQSIIDIYSQMSAKTGFESAFSKIYGVEWKSALPVLAKTIYANIKGK
jgi:hypothetical protein